jgi:hypothetical protein
MVFVKTALARDLAILPIPDTKLMKKHQEELVRFCQRIENEEDKEIQQLMKNYTVIRIKSVMEYHLKAFIADLIDSNNIKAENVTMHDSITIDLDVVDNLQKEQFTKGKILTYFLGTLPPNTIDNTFSRINEVQFFPWYQAIEELRTSSKTNGDTIEDFIRNNNKNRNDIIHNLKDGDETLDELKLDIPALLKFIKNVYAFTCLNLAIKNNDEKSSQKYCAMLKIKKDQFVKITKDHSQSLLEHRTNVKKKKSSKKRKN